MNEIVEKSIKVIPSKKQINWQKLEFTVFFHYGINSFTNREWGDGSEDISIFNPQSLNTDQWCECLVRAGIKGCIITAKHHDGFCLFDTKFTKHSVMYTPYQKDIVKQLSNSCAKYGLKLGIYLSPWDRHERTYGLGKEYDDYFCNQLTELLTNYGEIYSVWFDGACGEGPNGKKQVYDWQRYYNVINQLQPNAVISVCGPDVRWCGNEAGDCRESEWSVVPSSLIDSERVQESSQKSDDESFRDIILKCDDKDLGSREKIKNAKKLVWYPAEVDKSIRPGWFHHPNEDDKVISLDKLITIYLRSVGGNSVLLLNIPPHKDGYITKYDETRLKEIGDFIKNTFKDNLFKNAMIDASSTENNFSIENVKSQDENYWKAIDSDENCQLNISFKEPVKVSYITFMEQITQSQRIEKIEIHAEINGTYQKVHECGTVGYKRICKLDNAITSSKWKINILESRKCPTLKFMGFYQ